MNANNPQSPGVYTVEKNAFFPSVAMAPSTIPAFIGYTEKAIYNNELLKKPLLIKSMNEFEEHFGGRSTNKYPLSKATKDKHDLSLNSQFFSINKPQPGNKFYLYNCLQFFFQNGGGSCYIMSIGNYTTEVFTSANANTKTRQPTIPDKNHFLNGLAELANIQNSKPTIILAPDALLLESEDYYTVQEQILMQCGDLKDRVALIDVYDGDQEDQTEVISKFRNGIGTNFLQYGISYYPFLETTVVEASDMTYANVDQVNGVALDTIFEKKDLIGLANIAKDISALQNLQETPPIDFSQPFKGLPSADSTATSYSSWEAAFNAFDAKDKPAQTLQWQLRVILALATELYQLGNSTTHSIESPKFSIADTNLISAVSKITSPQSSVFKLISSLYPYDQHFKKELDVLTESSFALIGIKCKT